MTPFLASTMRRNQSSPSAIGGVALISTFVALLITDILTDGVSISGVGTWIGATVVVWVGSLLAVFILPYFGLRRYLDERRVTSRSTRASRGTALEECAEPVRSFVARSPRSRDVRGLLALGPLSHQPLRLPDSDCPPVRMSPTIAWVRDSASSAISDTRPIRGAVAASKRSPVTK